MVRPFDKHIDSQELNALVPWPSETGQEPNGLSPETVLEAGRHVQSCAACSSKIARYRQLVGRLSNVVVSEATPSGGNCPRDVDWYEVAAGLWPEWKTRQLIMHAALCDHCGPLLRASTSVDDDPTPQEERLLAELNAPLRPVMKVKREAIPPASPIWQKVLQWKVFVPAIALMLIVGVLGTKPSSSPTPIPAPKFAEFAVSTHRQHAHGSLALDVRSDSQQMLNEWFRSKLPFFLALPVPPAAPGENRLYLPEGARLVQVGGKTAAYIAYRVQASPVGLLVTPASVVVASGGVQVDFKTVSFHYRMVKDYKVVTWTVHGLTYALVSQEGNNTQRSCMVCHYPMRDRDLSQTPDPLSAGGDAVQPMLQ